MTAPWLLAMAFAPMAIEGALSTRHERALRAAGAVEPDGDVYAIMQLAYPASFLGIAVEAWLRHAPADRWFAAGLITFACAKALKYWAIATLGTRWTFRVLVPPTSSRIASGPYRFLPHPNYVAVAAELLGMGLMGHAPIAGALAVIGFGGLMLARIRVEERALG
jgi:methyltransferase